MGAISVLSFSFSRLRLPNRLELSFRMLRGRIIFERDPREFGKESENMAAVEGSTVAYQGWGANMVDGL